MAVGGVENPPLGIPKCDCTSLLIILFKIKIHWNSDYQKFDVGPSTSPVLKRLHVDEADHIHNCTCEDQFFTLHWIFSSQSITRVHCSRFVHQKHIFLNVWTWSSRQHVSFGFDALMRDWLKSLKLYHQICNVWLWFIPNVVLVVRSLTCFFCFLVPTIGQVRRIFTTGLHPRSLSSAPSRLILRALVWTCW